MKKKIMLILGILLGITTVCGALYYFFVARPAMEEKEAQKQLIAQYYTDKLALYQQENEAYADYEVDVAFLGDSLTDGCDLSKYYPQYKTANRGIGGETTIGLQKRMQVSAYDLRPKVVVMLIGGNNLDTMFDNYEELLIGLQTNLPRTKVILVSLTSMGNQWAHKNSLAAYQNVKIKLLAEKYGFAFVDVFSPLLDAQTNEIRAEYTVEGVHLNDAGYWVLQAAITPAIDAALASYEQ